MYAPASYITIEFSDELKQAMLNKPTEQQVKIVLQYENGSKTQVVETAIGEGTLKAWSQLQAK